jgi:hypothetical protein
MNFKTALRMAGNTDVVTSGDSHSTIQVESPLIIPQLGGRVIMGIASPVSFRTCAMAFDYSIPPYLSAAHPIFWSPVVYISINLW